MNIKMGKTFVRGKENYSLAEKKELGELVEKYKKEDDKEVKTMSFFYAKGVYSVKLSGKVPYPINPFLTPPPGIFHPSSAYYILYKFPTPLLIRTPPFYSGP